MCLLQTFVVASKAGHNQKTDEKENYFRAQP